MSSFLSRGCNELFLKAIFMGDFKYYVYQVPSCCSKCSFIILSQFLLCGLKIKQHSFTKVRIKQRKR